jgi:hypothetical protein
VTSPWCSPDRGIWTLVFNGPGQVNSAATVGGLDGFLSGNFDGGGPTADIGCDTREYSESGAQQVDTSGRYYLIDMSYFFGLGLCVAVYSAPFNSANPIANRIALLSDAYYEAVNLNSGQNYYFVVSPSDSAATGNYFYLVTPGTDLHIDPVLSGGWYDPASSGQGFFFDVLGHEQILFIGWFTYDLQRPAGNVQAMMGDPGHRWLTAFGNFATTTAALELEVTTGGVFNQGGGVNQVVDGSIDLEFFDCNTGQVTYDLGSVGEAGVIQIQRISNINSRACVTLMQRSGTPRKLNRN